MPSGGKKVRDRSAAVDEWPCVGFFSEVMGHWKHAWVFKKEVPGRFPSRWALVRALYNDQDTEEGEVLDMARPHRKFDPQIMFGVLLVGNTPQAVWCATRIQI